MMLQRGEGDDDGGRRSGCKCTCPRSHFSLRVHRSQRLRPAVGAHIQACTSTAFAGNNTNILTPMLVSMVRTIRNRFCCLSLSQRAEYVLN